MSIADFRANLQSAIDNIDDEDALLQYLTRLLQEVDHNVGDVSISYSPEVIQAGTKQYVLKFPIRCLFEKEEDYYVIKNELLDLIGTGETEDEAKQNFGEEFDYLYRRLIDAEEKTLAPRLVQIKQFISGMVKEIL